MTIHNNSPPKTFAQIFDEKRGIMVCQDCGKYTDANFTYVQHYMQHSVCAKCFMKKIEQLRKETADNSQMPIANYRPDKE